MVSRDTIRDDWQQSRNDIQPGIYEEAAMLRFLARNETVAPCGLRPNKGLMIAARGPGRPQS
jgi:hypothetical protein